jgi:hypothetical protein
MSKDIITKKDYVLVSIIFVLASALTIRYNFHELDMLTILDDEFGYWANAAIIAGVDWKPLLAETRYYSIGYSLVLVPIFFITSNTTLMYQLAIVLNALFLMVMMFISFFLSRRINPTINKAGHICISLLSVISVQNMYQARTAWSEVLLSLLVWISVLLLWRLENSFSVWTILGLYLIAFYMCLVHRRMIPVAVFIAISSVAITYKNNHTEIKNVLRILLILATISCVLLGIYLVINNVHVNAFYSDSQTASINNESPVEIMGGYLSGIVNSLKDIVFSFLGKCLVALVETYFFSVIILIHIIQTVIYTIKTKKEPIEFVNITELYVFAIFIVMIILTAFHASSPSRKDIPVYSRYFDQTIGPIILFGCSTWLKERDRYKKILLLFPVSIWGLGVVYSYIDAITVYFNLHCSPFIGGIFYMQSIIGKYSGIVAPYYFTVRILMLLFIAYLGIRKSESSIVLLCIGLLVFNAVITHYADDTIDQGRSGQRDRIITLYEKIVEDDSEIYFIKHDDVIDEYTRPKYLQYKLLKRTIHTCYADQISDLKDGSWVLAYTDKDIANAYKLDLNYVTSTESMTLYKKN